MSQVLDSELKSIFTVQEACAGAVVQRIQLVIGSYYRKVDHRCVVCVLLILIIRLVVCSVADTAQKWRLNLVRV
jgi:hypothetical protein